MRITEINNFGVNNHTDKNITIYNLDNNLRLSYYLNNEYLQNNGYKQQYLDLNEDVKLNLVGTLLTYTIPNIYPNIFVIVSTFALDKIILPESNTDKSITIYNTLDTNLSVDTLPSYDIHLDIIGAPSSVDIPQGNTKRFKIFKNTNVWYEI